MWFKSFAILFAVAVTSFSTWANAQQITCSGNDVTQQLQSFIDQDLLTPNFIQFTEGTCRIRETVKICNKDGLRIEGAGQGGTVLQWNPDNQPADAPMFSVQNSSGIAFSSFSVCIGGGFGGTSVTLNSAFDLYNPCFDCVTGTGDQCDPTIGVEYHPGVPPRSHGNSFTNIDIASCRGDGGLLNYGIRIKLFGERADLVYGDVAQGYGSLESNDYGADYDAWLAEVQDSIQNPRSIWGTYLRIDQHNEHHSFTNVSVSEFRQSAFVVEGRNAYGNTFTNVHCDGKYSEPDPLNSPNGWGRICVETGQNEWSDASGEWQHEHIHEPGATLDSVGPSTQGHFFWYGGTAKNISDAVFVLGYNPTSPINIFGLSAESSRALLKALKPYSPRVPLPLVIDSVQFDTDGVHTWDASTNYIVPNPYGIIVDYPYHGPLVMKNNTIGNCPSLADTLLCDPENISIYWRYLETGNEGDVHGSFIFEGNALSTTNPNPFMPIDAAENPKRIEEGVGIYPTSQDSNLISMEAGDTAQWSWETMPQHFTTIPYFSPTRFDISMLPTSSHYFLLEGAPPMSPTTQLTYLEHGVVGQEAILIAGGPVTVAHEEGFIELSDGLSWPMAEQDVLWLVLDPDGVWREMARGENR